jgi:hypothetical protein
MNLRVCIYGHWWDLDEIGVGLGLTKQDGKDQHGEGIVWVVRSVNIIEVEWDKFEVGKEEGWYFQCQFF